MPWDKIQATAYRTKSSINHFVPELRSLHLDQVSDNAEFEYLREAFAYRKEQNEDNTVSLNEVARITEKKDREAFWLALENKKRVAQGLETIASLDDLNPEETVIASATPPLSSGGAAIVPDGESDGEATPVDGSEMAGLVDIPSNIPASTDETSSPDAEEDEQADDPYLVESSHILLDLISLEERTAADLLRSQGS